MGEAKMLIVAPNVEATGDEGGLDDVMLKLLDAAREKDLPVVYALSRKKLGKALGSGVSRVSAACLLILDGVHEEAKEVLRLAETARAEWRQKFEEPTTQ